MVRVCIENSGTLQMMGGTRDLRIFRDLWDFFGLNCTRIKDLP